MDTTAALKPKALIIDDDGSHRRLAQVIFERNGFDVSIAHDGSEGVRQALINPPAVVILDLMMEGLHGFEVCKMLRANPNLRHTAIIITSGKSYKADVDKAIQMGADAYVVKPFLPKELLEIATLYMNLRASQP
ncbi:MAG: response regulator [Bacteroidota bacterium]|jgi:DNA-binding response OmpR family regulator